MDTERQLAPDDAAKKLVRAQQALQTQSQRCDRAQSASQAQHGHHSQHLRRLQSMHDDDDDEDAEGDADADADPPPSTGSFRLVRNTLDDNDAGRSVDVCFMSGAASTPASSPASSATAQDDAVSPVGWRGPPPLGALTSPHGARQQHHHYQHHQLASDGSVSVASLVAAGSGSVSSAGGPTRRGPGRPRKEPRLKEPREFKLRR